MDGRRSLLTVWNWLPAFQAVAETEHLPTASERLGVTASALSRSITMLEDRLGRQLFTRRGRQLVLNADGRRLLVGMTAAFAALDDSVAALSSAELEGPLYASAAGPLAQMLVVPALRDLQKQGRGLVPYIYGYEQQDAVRLLRAGQLDVIFDSAGTKEPDLVTTFLGDTANGVYCGREHPLFAGQSAADLGLLNHGFVVTCAPGRDGATDAFPADTARRIEMYVHQLSVVLEVCLSGHLLAVLPEFVARALVRDGSLRRLSFADLPSTPLYATYARAHAANARVRSVVAAVGEARARVAAHEIAGAVAARDVARPSVRMTPGEDVNWFSRGDALFARGELRAARAAYAEASMARRHLAGDVREEDARHALRVTRLLVREGQYEEAERQCAGALDALAGADAVIGASLEATVALASSFRGDTLKARESLERARALAGSVVVGVGNDARGVHRMRALVQRSEGNLLVSLGRPREAVLAYTGGAESATAGSDAWEHSIALFNLAEAEATLGAFERVGELLGAAEREKEEIGDLWGLAHVLHLRAKVALGERRPDVAAEAIVKALEIAAGLTDPRLVSTCNVTLGEVHLAQGEGPGARHAFELAVRDAVHCGARIEQIRALVGLSTTELRRGDYTRARAFASEAHALVQSGDAPFARATPLIALAEVSTSEGRHADAAALYREALALTSERGAGVR
jgi:DNA-binding transcriptional LysR family regulator/predicted negative regulator of RcsB-dependent stress response